MTNPPIDFPTIAQDSFWYRLAYFQRKNPPAFGTRISLCGMFWNSIWTIFGVLWLTLCVVAIGAAAIMNWQWVGGVFLGVGIIIGIGSLWDWFHERRLRRRLYQNHTPTTPSVPVAFLKAWKSKICPIWTVR